MISQFVQWLNENKLWGLVITVLVILVIGSTYYWEKQWEARSGADQFGYYSRMEFWSIDLRHRLLSRPERASDDIVIVSLTESAIKRYQNRWGRWPWPRRVIAEVLRYLRKSEFVLVDIGFLEKSGIEIPPQTARRLQMYMKQGRALQQRKPGKADRFLNVVQQKLGDYSESDDVTLGEYSKAFGPVHYATWFPELVRGVPDTSTLNHFGNVMDRFGYGFEGDTSPFPRKSFMSPPIDPLIENSYAVSHISFTPDPDGPARRFDPFIGIQDYPERNFYPETPYLPILGMSGALQSFGFTPGESKFTVSDRQLHLGDTVTVPLDRKGNVLINYRGGLKTGDPSTVAFEEVPIENILDPILPDQNYVEDPPEPEYFEGKKVFIGATAPGLFDLRATPFSANEAGVAIHANILDMMMTDNFLIPIKARDTLFAIVLLTLTVGVIATFLSPLMALTLTVLITSLYVVAGFGLYNQGRLINLTAPLVASYLNYGLILVYNLVFEQRKRRQVKKAFQHYLTASVMEEILKDPDKLELGGERREISVLFADIAGFTTFSEGRTATEVASVINKILTEMTDCIFRYEGVLDKYIGDEMVAEFGIIPVEPEDHATRALNAACDMRIRMEELREEWREQGSELLQLRIGVHTGLAATGNMGSEMLFDYTALGDNVNLGSRLEGANKQYNTLSMISEDTYNKVDGNFEVREIDRIIVKGKDEPVTVLELLGREGEVDDRRLELRDRFEEALGLYRDQQWDEAIERFEALVEEYPDDGPSPIFLERCREFKEQPPEEGWDGVYRLTSK
jgi:adenylate cyclase